MGEKEHRAWTQTDLSLSPALPLVGPVIQGESSFLPEPQSSDLESGITVPPRGGATVVRGIRPVSGLRLQRGQKRRQLTSSLL